LRAEGKVQPPEIIGAQQFLEGFHGVLMGRWPWEAVILQTTVSIHPGWQQIEIISHESLGPCKCAAFDHPQLTPPQDSSWDFPNGAPELESYVRDILTTAGVDP
jgi:hypothetical protein